jgi:hypothetical protein
MTTARDNTQMELLTSGLSDWIHLGEIHYQVQQDNPGSTVDDVQRETMHTIRSLVSDGLVEIGDLSGPDGQFVAWDTSLEESLERIAAAYINEFQNEAAWLWVFWLNLTDKGRWMAEAIQSGAKDN